MSNAYFLNIEGNNMRDDGKDFHITAYVLSHIQDKGTFELKDINAKPMKYHI